MMVNQDSIGTVGAIVIDGPGSIQSFDGALENLFGYADDEILGKDLAVLIPELDRFESADLAGREREVSARRKDGTIFPAWFAVNGVRVGGTQLFVGSVVDLSGWKDVDGARAQLSALVASSNDAIMSKTLEGIVTSWNPAAEALFGYTEREMIGRPMVLLMPPDRIEEETVILGKIRKGEKIEHFETIRQRKNGELIPVSVTISPIRDASGTIIGASKIARDLSGRKAADKIHTQLSALVASSTDAIMSKTLEGIVTSWNPAAEALFGYTEREMIGRPMALLFPPDRIEEEAVILGKIRRGEKIEHFETIRRRKNGEQFPISVTISPIKDASGTIIGASKIARDISDQKAAEAELRQHRDHLEELVSVATAEVNAIVQTAVSGIVTIDAKGRIQVFNPSAERLFGWSKDEIVGKNIALLMEEPLSSQHDEYLERYLATGKSRIIGIEREVRARRKDGSVFPAHLALGHAEISDANHFFVGFISDITEQKRNEAVLRRAKEEAEAGAQVKSAFVANMSHEIRTPMNAILGFAEVVLQDVDLPKQSARHVQIIVSSAKALLGIINDVLDVSKMESGKFALETVDFHLPNALTDALRVVDHQAAEKGLRIVLEYDAALPLRFAGDPTRLRQVVLNLVGNSIKFSEKGAITISVRPGDQADMLHFAVTDRGIGMTAEQAAKVFEPFSQADVSTTRRFGGTGLGTAISKQITELMGGDIWVESEPGQGSTFHFTAWLPEAADGAACLYEEGSTVVDGYVSPREFKVMLVEDIETNAALATLRLRQQGHGVEWKANGREAVAAFQTGRYDLILMDVMMPEMDGLEASREIRKLERASGGHIPIVALTASVMREDYDLCIEAGMDSIQAKPIDFSALFSAMEQVVPAGGGRPNTVRRIEIGAPSGVDFSSLEGIADLRSAIRTWRDPLAYAKALVTFAADRAGDADEMERLLLATPHDAEPARAVAHALKGVSGNLFVAKVAACAIEIDADLKAARRKAAMLQLGELRGYLAEAVTAIGKIVVASDEAAAPAKVLDPKEAVSLFEGLLSALAELNPDAVEPILARMAEYLPKTDLLPIQKGLDSFDFDAAKAGAIALAERLGLWRD